MTYLSYNIMRRLLNQGDYIGAAEQLDDCREKKELLKLFHNWKAQETREREEGIQVSNDDRDYRNQLLENQSKWMDKIANNQLKIK